ncbi:MAG: thioredoxin family protein [Actinomycetota bacterium]
MTTRLLLAAGMFALVGGAVLLWRRPPRRLGTSSLASIGIREAAIVQFTTASCGPCKVAAPHLRDAAERAAIPYHQVDVGERPDVARDYGIRRVPTIAVTGSGGRVLGVWTGLSGEIAETALTAGSVSA